jgi:hypothetical protein
MPRGRDPTSIVSMSRFDLVSITETVPERSVLTNASGDEACVEGVDSQPVEMEPLAAAHRRCGDSIFHLLRCNGRDHLVRRHQIERLTQVAIGPERQSNALMGIECQRQRHVGAGVC